MVYIQKRCPRGLIVDDFVKGFSGGYFLKLLFCLILMVDVMMVYIQYQGSVQDSVGVEV